MLHHVAEFARVAVEGDDTGAGAGGGASGGKARAAGAEDYDASGRDSGGSADQDSTAAGAGAQQVRRNGHGHLTSEFANSGQDGKPAILLLNDFAADGGEAALSEGIEETAICHGHVVEGHDRGAGRAPIEFGEGGAGDFGEEFGAPDGLLWRVGDLGSGAGGSRYPGTWRHRPRLGFHPHGMPRALHKRRTIGGVRATRRSKAPRSRMMPMFIAAPPRGSTRPPVARGWRAGGPT